MATNWLKSRIFRYLPQPYYRLFYNLLALLTFVPVVLSLRLAPVEQAISWVGSIWIGGYLLAAGMFITLLALKQYDLREFLGWPINPPTTANGQLKENGLLRYVRHPLYLGTLVGLAGIVVLHPCWKYIFFSVAAFAYIRIGIYYEERKLIRTYGNQYVQYQKRVPMLLPVF